MNRTLRILVLLTVLVWLAAACVNPMTGQVMEPLFVSPTPTPTLQPPTPTPTPGPTEAPPTAMPVVEALAETATPEIPAETPVAETPVTETPVAEARVDPDSPFAKFVLRDPSFTVPDLGVEILRPGPDWLFINAKAMGLTFGAMLPVIMLHQPPPAQEEIAPESAPETDLGRFLTVASLDAPAVSLRALARIMAANPEAGLEILADEMGEMGQQAELAKVGPYNAVKVSTPALLDGVNYLWIVVRPGAVIYLLAEGFSDPAQAADLVAGAVTFVPLAGEEVQGQDLLPNPDEAGITPEEQRQRLVAVSQQVRSLDSLDAVDFNLMDEAELRAVLEEDSASDMDSARRRAGEERMLKLLGLIPEETDLMALLLDLYQSEIAGYYDDETKEFVLVQPEDGGTGTDAPGSAPLAGEEGAGLDLMAQITFVHEFVHALQDQHLDLARFGGNAQEDEAQPSDDEQLAVRALVEGDAQFATTLYIIDYVDLVALYELSKAEEMLDDGATDAAAAPAESVGDTLEVEKEVALEGEIDTALLDSAPAFVRASMLFPYLSGEQFVLAIYDELGWDGVNQVWANPPASTEQILHPDLYPEDLPTPVDLPRDLAVQLGAASGAAWEESVRNVWGEFQLRQMLATHLSENMASSGADGWDGDQFVYLSDGAQEVVVMAIVWDSASEARSARTALRTWLDRSGFGSSGALRFVDEAADPTAGSPVRHAFLTSRDTWVYFALATDSPSLEAALSALGWE